MESRMLEITLVSTKDLKDVNLSSKMGVYAVGSIIGYPFDSKQKQKTHVDKDGEPNPTWNYPMKFTVNEEALQQNYLMLKFKIKSDRSCGQKDIGEVHISIKDLFDQKAGQQLKDVRFTVQTPSGEAKGILEFNYKFGDKFAAAAPGHMAASGSTGSPASLLPHGEPGNAQPAYAYHCPPPGGYPAPPPQNGYWYPPPPPLQQYFYQGYWLQGYGGYPQQQVVSPPKNSGWWWKMPLSALLLARLLTGDIDGINDIVDAGGCGLFGE